MSSPASGSKKTSPYLRFCRRVLEQRLLWVLFAAAIVGFLVKNVRDHGLEFLQWDLLLLSGFTTLVIGLHLAGTIPSRMRVAITRLKNRDILDIGDHSLENLLEDLDARSLRWAGIAGPAAALIVTVAFFVAVGNIGASGAQLSVVLLRATAAFIAGLHFGRMASYGALGYFLKQRTCHIRVWPGHIDGAAGLKPVGDFYFYQAMVAAMPAMFLAAWVILIPAIGRYEQWRDPYLGELVVAMFIEIAAFVVPLLWFHREMLDSKFELLMEADQLSTEFLAPQAPSLAEEARNAEKDQAKVEWAKGRYESIEALPTWPVDVKTRRRFSVNNLVLLLPLLGQTELAGRITGILGVFG